MAGTFNWSIDQGTDVNLIFTWTSGSPLAPVDLTGYSAHLQIRSSYGLFPASVVYLDLTSSGGGLVLGGIAGTIQVVISNAATSALNWEGAAAYDLKLTSPGGLVTRLIEGSVLLNPEVTV